MKIQWLSVCGVEDKKEVRNDTKKIRFGKWDLLSLLQNKTTTNIVYRSNWILFVIIELDNTSFYTVEWVFWWAEQRRLAL